MALLLLMGFGLVACSKDKGDGDDTDPNPPTQGTDPILDTSGLVEQFDAINNFILYLTVSEDMNMKVVIKDIGTAIAVENTISVDMGSGAVILYVEDDTMYVTDSDKDNAHELDMDTDGETYMSAFSFFLPSLFVNDEYFEFVNTNNDLNNFQVQEENLEEYINASAQGGTVTSIPTSAKMTSNKDNDKFSMNVEGDGLGMPLSATFELGNQTNPLA